ncbi:MAG: HD-GYP domain-containing protein [Nitrospiraceae bacterium]
MVRFADLIRGGAGKDSPQDKDRKGPPAETPGQEREAPATRHADPSDPVSLKPAQPERAPEPSQPDIDWYGLAEAELTRIMEAVRQNEPFRLDDLTPIATGIVEALRGSDQLLARALSRQNRLPLIASMVNVGIVSTKVGMGLGYPQDQQVRLALAALVHDLGMFRLPESQLNDTGRWSAEQIDGLRGCPMMGAELLKQQAPEYPWLPEVVAQAHERGNGTGYPQGLHGDQIHELAQVIGVADVMDALLHPRRSVKARLPHEAVRMLVAEEKTAFPDRIFKSLLQELSLYPVGTWVKLTSGETGEVVRLNRRYPLRPVVRVSIGQNGQRLQSPRELDLGRNPLVHVKEIADTALIPA